MRMQCMKLYYTVIDTFALEMQRGNKKHYKFSDTRNEVTIQTLNSIFSPALYAFVLLRRIIDKLYVYLFNYLFH